VLDHIVKEKRSELVSVNYSFGSKRFERCATPFDIALSDALTRVFDKLSFPIQRMPDGEESRRNDDIGVTHVHQFYTPRNIATLSVAFDLAAQDTELWLAITGTLISVSRMYRWTPNYEGGEPLSGTLYIPALTRDISAYDAIKRFLAKLPNVHRCLAARYSGGFLASTASMSNLHIPPNSLDYIFLDPPFGANINYSELSFLWEAWLRVITNNRMEAIQNKSQCKGLDEYRTLITKCLESAYTALKPGRWITIEFSNTKAAVWNAIQSAMQEVGFVVANVSSLDKKSRTFKAINSPTAVKQDLVISAYKPTGRLEDRFRRIGHTIEGVWDFLSAHLRNLPVLKLRGGDLEFIGERDPRILYDRMVAFYVGHGVPVPLSSAEFQAALAEKFPEREGMFFLPDQVDIWDKKRAQVQGVGQMSIFVEDEKSAIDWLRSFLKNRPSVVADITPEFMQQLGASWKKFETRPELRVLLEQNFLKYDGNGEVPGQIHGYLSTQFKDLRNLAKDDSHLQSRAKDRWYVPDPGKAVDVEAVRNKRLLAEFWDLCAQAGINRPASEQSDQGRLPFPAAAPAKKGARKKLKEVRTEAVRLGFKECFAAKNYATILALSEHLPENVIEEDEQLQMIHDMADMRAEG
jgi:16S rRNA G966 N2-methylase RsmD